jgi:RNA recognition motif-containing protein
VNLFVGNLPLEMTVAELKQEFMPFGEIACANIMNDKYIGSGQSRGYGYVEMTVRAQGEAAIVGLNGKVLHNHTLDVLEAIALSPVRSSVRPAGNCRQRS